MKVSRLAASVVIVVSGCAGAAQPTPNTPVRYDEWCNVVCQDVGARTASQCGAQLVEQTSCAMTCEMGRGAQTSQRTHDELEACTAYINTLNCQQVGFAMGQGLVGAGEFGTRCGAR